jgi:hypothetical protein
MSENKRTVFVNDNDYGWMPYGFVLEREEFCSLSKEELGSFYDSLIEGPIGTYEKFHAAAQLAVFRDDRDQIKTIMLRDRAAIVMTNKEFMAFQEGGRVVAGETAQFPSQIGSPRDTA